MFTWKSTALNGKIVHTFSSDPVILDAPDSLLPGDILVTVVLSKFSCPKILKINQKPFFLKYFVL